MKGKAPEMKKPQRLDHAGASEDNVKTSKEMNVMSNAIAIPAENNWSGAPIRVFVGQIGGFQASVCDARELHAYLQNGDMFANWIKARIEKYGFEENRDFHSFLESTKKPKGGRPSTEYHLSIDMAKELGMVENNERGRWIRRYFIECEKRLRAIAPSEADTILKATIGTDGFHCLAAVLDGKVRHLPAKLRTGAKNHIWSQVRKGFSVSSVEDIPASSLDAARNFIGSYTLPLEGEWIEREKPVEATRLDIHFPVDYLSGRRPGTQYQRNEHTDYLDVHPLDLVDPHESPCELILSRLSRAGYDVAAAWWEVRTYRNKLAQMHRAIESLKRNFESPQQYVINREVAA